MRSTSLACLSSIVFVTTSFAQLNLTVYRNPNLSDSVTLRWQQPATAIPPVTYSLFSSQFFGTQSPLDTLIDATSYVIQISAGFGYLTRYFSVIATDNQGIRFQSDTCGYKRFLAVGAPELVSTPFGIPFITWDVINGVPRYGIPSSDPSDVIGDQSACGSIWNSGRILRQDNGAFAIRSQTDGCAWRYSLQINHGMTAARAYWYQNGYYLNQVILICGKADAYTPSPPVIVHSGTPTSSVSTPYSWREPRVFDPTTLSLFSQSQCAGLDFSDRLLAQVGGTYLFYRFSDNTWQGQLHEIRPGQNYWIQRRCSTSYTYTYDPNHP